MEHLIIKSIVIFGTRDFTDDLCDKVKPNIDNWIGKYATTLNTNIIAREIKKVIGWHKFKVWFSEFDCRTGRLVLRAKLLNNKSIKV